MVRNIALVQIKRMIMEVMVQHSTAISLTELHRAVSVCRRAARSYCSRRWSSIAMPRAILRAPLVRLATPWFTEAVTTAYE